MVGGVDGEEEKGGQVHYLRKRVSMLRMARGQIFSASYDFMGWCIAKRKFQRIAWYLLRSIQLTAMQKDVLPIAMAQRDCFLPYLLVFLDHILIRKGASFL